MPNDDKSIDAMPTKAFFVNMLVRDISLERAVLDLLDNCIDGAKSLRPGDDADYTGLHVKIEMDGEAFRIADNCGGFGTEKARSYAFRFGRPDEAESTAYSIGQFGVGMKRALFKFGTYFEVESTTEHEHWSMHVDVNEWLGREADWAFVFDDVVDDGEFADGERGTRIVVRNLRPEVANRFRSVYFRRQLANMIQAHEREFLALGLAVELDEQLLTATELRVRTGGAFHPAIEEFVHEAESDAPVTVRLVVGVSEAVPASAGWYVVCNRRVIVSADRSDYTGWGTLGDSEERLPKYTNAYARFRGVVFFDCEDPRKMPWNTTKTGLDDGAVVWQRAYEKMRDHARSVVNFLNAMANEVSEYGREASPLLAALQGETSLVGVEEFDEASLQFAWNQDPPEVGPKMVSIQYSREEEKIDALKAMFEVRSAKAVGEESFDWAYEALGDEGE